MDWRQEWWWLLVLVAAWGTVFLASGPRKLRAYYIGGIWSLALAAVSEYIIRQPIDFWETSHTLLAVGGVELALLLGPRLTEGILFYQFLPKQTSLQLPAVLFWATQAVAADLGAIVTANAFWSWQGLIIGIMLHLFRFAALLAIYYGMAYEKRAERLGAILQQETRRRRGATAWKYSWIPFYFGIRALVSGVDRLSARKSRHS